MKKELVTVTIAVHPFQKKLIEAIMADDIDLEGDTLREMAKKINIEEHPQSVKHHLEQLVKLGAIQKMYGQYIYLPTKK